MEKTCFMAPVKYNPNGKGIMAPKEYTPMKKAWSYGRLFKKIQHKRYNANQN